MAHQAFVCECGYYKIFDGDLEDPTTSSGACKNCGSKSWDTYSKEEYSNSDHWRMICLARHVLKQGSNRKMRVFLDKFEKRNGASFTIKLKEFCRAEYDKAMARLE